MCKVVSHRQEIKIHWGELGRERENILCMVSASTKGTGTMQDLVSHSRDTLRPTPQGGVIYRTPSFHLGPKTNEKQDIVAR